MPNGEDEYTVRSIERACDLLEELAASDEPQSLTDLAEQIDVPRPTLFRYLRTLEARRFVERTSDGDYRLGSASSLIGSGRSRSISERAEPLLRQLRDALQETTNLGVLDGTSVVYAAIHESPLNMRLAARPGARDPVHSTALGKAIASMMSDEEVTSLLTSTGLPKRTEATVSTVEAFLKEVSQVRKNGFALDEGENEPGSRCVAVGVPGIRPLYAVSVSAPSSRLSKADIRRVADELQRIALALAGRAASG